MSSVVPSEKISGLIFLGRLAGFRPPSTERDFACMEAVRREFCPAQDAAAEVMAQVRATGLSGFIPATTDDEKARVIAVRKPPTATHPKPANDVPPQRSTPSQAPRQGLIPHQSSVAAAPPAQASEPLFAEFRIIGTAGIKSAKDWQAANGIIGVPSANGEYRFEEQCKSWRNVIFRVPADRGSRDIVRRAAGNLDDHGYLRLRLSRNAERPSVQYCGPGAKALPAALAASREPPTLPYHLLQALARVGA